MHPLRAVQPWGRDKVKQSILISRHQTAADAFAAIDAMAARFVATGAPADAVELIVLDVDDGIVHRPAH